MSPDSEGRDIDPASGWEEEQIWGPCFKAQELVAQKGSVLLSRRPSRRFRFCLLLALFSGGMKTAISINPRLYHLNAVIVNALCEVPFIF